jgi:hypothetical protein
MSDLRSDMSGLQSDMSGKLDLAQWKSRSGSKMMNLSPDKLTTCKLATKKLRENKGTTRNNLNTRNHTQGEVKL